MAKPIALLGALLIGMLLIAPAASAGSKGSIVVKPRISGEGIDNPKGNGLTICLQKDKGYETSAGVCGVVKKGKVKLKSKAGRYYLRAYGGLGSGPCYAKRGDGFKQGQCSKVKVKAGKVEKLTWKMPLFG